MIKKPLEILNLDINEFNTIYPYGYFIVAEPYDYSLRLSFSSLALVQLIKIAERQGIISGNIVYPHKHSHLLKG